MNRIFFCVLFFYASISAQTLDAFIDMRGLERSGDSWEVYDENVRDDEGHIKLHHSKWLMYFLHWRPLTDENESLTCEYLRHHMLNFWGESMPFALTGNEGEMEVCGHKALYTEGTIYNGAIHTRFIVWNCPETGRQFTADCNINVRRGTPERYLELQQKITETVSCHKGMPLKQIEGLSQEYTSSLYNVSFYIPENCRTADFMIEEWFPEGMSEEYGTLWTLLTDSEKHVELFWQKTDTVLSAGLFNAYMRKAYADTSMSEDSSLSMISEIWRHPIEKDEDILSGKGSYRFTRSRKGRSQCSDYIFRAYLWRSQGYVYFLLGSIIHVRGFWGLANELLPSEEVLSKFLGEVVFPNIKVMDNRIRQVGIQ